MDTALIIAGATAVTAPLLGYLAATRKLSGKISTSDASYLWEESRAIRSEYREENDRLRIKVAVLESKLEDIQKDCKEHITNNAVFAHQITELKERVAALKAENADLLSENATLSARVNELELHISKLEETATNG